MDFLEYYKYKTLSINDMKLIISNIFIINPFKDKYKYLFIGNVSLPHYFLKKHIKMGKRMGNSHSI